MLERRELMEPIPTGLDIILDQVECVGNESELSECAHNEFGNELNCDVNEATGCLCFDGTCSDNYQGSFCVIWCNKMTRLYRFTLKIM